MLRLLRNVTVAGVLSQIVTYGENSKIASFHTDPVEVWGSRFLITTICIGIAVLLFTLFKFRGTTAGPFLWGVLGAGRSLISLNAKGLGPLLVFQRAGTGGFFASCPLTKYNHLYVTQDPQHAPLS